MTKEENNIKQNNKEQGKYRDIQPINLEKPSSTQQLDRRISSLIMYVERIKNKDYRICRVCGKEFLTRNIYYCRECAALKDKESRLKTSRKKKKKENILYIVIDPRKNRIIYIGETENFELRYASYKCKSIVSTCKFIKYMRNENKDVEDFLFIKFNLSACCQPDDTLETITHKRKCIEYYLQTNIDCEVDAKRMPRKLPYNEEQASRWLREVLEKSKTYEVHVRKYRTWEDDIKESYLYRWSNSDKQALPIDDVLKVKLESYRLQYYYDDNKYILRDKVVIDSTLA